MKIQFDANQGFQLDAVAAVGDLFDGQPEGPPEFSVIKMTEDTELFAGQERSELGLGNRLLVDDVRLNGNTRLIQARNDIEVSGEGAALEGWELFDPAANIARLCPHFSVEMETGTGKTYVICVQSSSFRGDTVLKSSSSWCLALQFAKVSLRTSRLRQNIFARFTTTCHSNISSTTQGA